MVVFQLNLQNTNLLVGPQEATSNYSTYRHTYIHNKQTTIKDKTRFLAGPPQKEENGSYCMYIHTKLLTVQFNEENSYIALLLSFICQQEISKHITKQITQI